jgi:hypothetical protein
MPDVTITNWFGDIVSHPRIVVDAHTVDDIIHILNNPGKYPSPVRAIGSNHSTTACGTSEGGTVIRIKMNRILNITADSLTVEAGAIHIDMALELAKQNLQFYVNTEIGNLTAGSAACCGTKDSSFPGEYGQVGSYVSGVKMVLPSGQLLEVTDAQLDLMQKVRASYGTFGIVYEVTFRIRPLLPLAVHHKTFHLAEFIQQLPQLKALSYAMMYYLFPFEDLITVEFRNYNAGASGEPNKLIWPLRNYIWGTSGPKFAHDMGQTISDPKIRYGIIDKFNALWRFKLENIITSDNTIAADEIIRYPDLANDSRYTFSLYAFPEEDFPSVLSAFAKFCIDYYAKTGYRTDLLDVGYRIAQDQQSLLSYSWDGPVMTLDPVSTGNPGWNGFIDAYNQFCSARNGKPVLNQTCALTPDLAKKAYGGRLATLEQTRKQYDPSGRLLNEYFRAILSS